MRRLRSPVVLGLAAGGAASLGLGLVLGAASMVGCYDATHDAQVAALGGEAPGVSPGPSHRPGQPCNVCHGGVGPASARFSLAGTIYTYPDTVQPSAGAVVVIQDATGFLYHATTNSVGNFFIPQDKWAPVYPITVPSLVDSTGMAAKHPASMTSLDNREGSCAACHTLTPGPDSVGPVTWSPFLSDGGKP